MGSLAAGCYRVTARLGRGGMGVVRRAVDAVLGRDNGKPLPGLPVR